MKKRQFVIVVVLAAVCLALSVATVVVAWSNQDLQGRIQVGQMTLNNGILGQRGQQIKSSLLQDMANASLQNEKMRVLLAKHGITVNPPAAGTPGAAASSNQVATATNAVEKTGGAK